MPREVRIPSYCWNHQWHISCFVRDRLGRCHGKFASVFTGDVNRDLPSSINLTLPVISWTSCDWQGLPCLVYDHSSSAKAQKAKMLTIANWGGCILHVVDAPRWGTESYSSFMNTIRNASFIAPKCRSCSNILLHRQFAHLASTLNCPKSNDRGQELSFPREPERWTWSIHCPLNVLRGAFSASFLSYPLSQLA